VLPKYPLLNNLLQDYNRLLHRINSEAKTRRSIRSLVIGTAKVMSYVDLDKARAARAAKDKAAADKSKVSTREVESEVEGDVDAQEVGSSVPTLKDRRAKRSNVPEPEP